MTAPKLSSFASLPIGSRFRWDIAPLWNDDYLDGIYVKTGETEFGHNADEPSWIVTNEMDWPVIPESTHTPAQ